MIDNPIRGRLNAWFFAALDSYMHWKYAELKSRLLSKASPVLVELGSGVGANFRYLQSGTRLIVFEPNRQMHSLLKRRAKRCGLDLDLRDLGGENLDLPSASVDCVFASLVLCSVEKPTQVIAEVRRVLKPGGMFICLEHVVAPTNSGINVLQRLIKRPWKWVFEGCDLCRDTASSIQSAGFSHVELQHLVLPTIFLPIRHQIAAMCVN